MTKDGFSRVLEKVIYRKREVFWRFFGGFGWSVRDEVGAIILRKRNGLRDETMG